MSLESVPLINHAHCCIMINNVLVACEEFQLRLATSGRIIDVERARHLQIVPDDDADP